MTVAMVVIETNERWILWRDRAIALLEQAIGELKDAEDALATISAAEACLRVYEGELPEDEMDGYPFIDEDPEPLPCTCPPGLVERGGWASTCQEHGR